MPRTRQQTRTEIAGESSYQAAKRAAVEGADPEAQPTRKRTAFGEITNVSAKIV